jgi:LmbE family N-acetylglucosaminyl deacetylase
MSTVLFAAHPDDIEFGMGGTLTRLHDVVCVLSFQCDMSRRLEAARALARLGVSSDRILYTTATQPRDLVAEYDRILETFRPMRVFTHFYGDSHQEHRLVYECALAALRRMPATTCLLWENIQPGALTHESFSGRVFVPLDADALDAKLGALREHTSQLAKYDTSRLLEFLRQKATTNGYLCGSPYAEVFFPVKFVLELK